MFQDGSQLDHFKRGRKGYNEIDISMKLVDRVEQRGGGWDRQWLKNNQCFVLIGLEVFYYPAATNVKREREAVDPERRLN